MNSRWEGNREGERDRETKKKTEGQLSRKGREDSESNVTARLNSLQLSHLFTCPVSRVPLHTSGEYSDVVSIRYKGARTEQLHALTGSLLHSIYYTDSSKQYVKVHDVHATYTVS